MEFIDKIRKEQKDALEVISLYWNDKKEKKYSLVKMPTGSGKTGIIACIQYYLQDINNILIVVPNGQLPKQIEYEIKKGFWNKMGIYNIKSEFQVKVLKGINSKLTNEEKNIYIITVQGMLSIFRENRELFKRLKKDIDLIIFDEGHRQPSKKWNRVIAEMDKKVVLFTATPYRNDKIKFNITNNEKYMYSLSYNQAIEKGYIKSVEFLTFPNELQETGYRNEFVELIDKLYKTKSMNSRKIIIRTVGSNNIKNIVNIINVKYKKDIAVGFHSKFTASETLKMKYSRFDNETFSVFVHENMLIEGIDMNEVDILIMHSDFENSRSIVQQIGRILRKKDENDIGNAIVYVAEKKINKYISQWNNFIEYDDKTTHNNIYYCNGLYREKFKLDNKFYEHIRLTKSANIYICENIDKREVIEAVEGKLNNNNVIYLYKKTDEFWLACYEIDRLSDILLDKIYLERSLEYCIITFIEDTIFYYDSYGFSLNLDELTFPIKKIDADKILNLLGSSSSLKQVKTDRLNISSYGKTSEVFNGNYLEKINESITENLVACTSVKGVVDEYIRYLSTDTAKINDYDKCTVYEYIGWAKNIYNLIQDNRVNIYFNRYAKVYFNINKDEYPTSILITANDGKIYCLNGNNEHKVNIDGVCIEIHNNKYDLKIENEIIKCEVVIEQKKRGVKIRNILDKNKYKVRLENGDVQSLQEYIGTNRFRLLFNTNLFYLNGHLYKPNINYFDIDLLEMSLGKRIKTIKELDNVKDEKEGMFKILHKEKNPEYIKKYESWDKNSVFGVLIDYINNNNKFEYIVCDDLNTEIADFIAISEQKIALIHCKYSGSKLSGSAFQDAVGQALKNLSYLSANDVESNNGHISKHIDRWDATWNGSKIARIMPNNISGEVFWQKYKQILLNLNKELEVWIFGNLMSYGSLKDNLKSRNPTEETKQIMWLLSSADEIISNVGATLKIFCNE